MVVAGANVPDAQLLEPTIDAVVLERPPIEEGWPQHLCLDKGYDNEDGWGACIDHDYEPHIALIRNERPARTKRHPRPLGQAGPQLPRPAQARLRAPLVPTLLSPRRSEIVT